MKIQEIIDRVLAYHPDIPGYESDPRACDSVKCGDPQQECTGIVLSVAPSVNVLREAIKLGANFVMVHEPAFYTHFDRTQWLEGDEVFEGKMDIIREGNLVIWRDHDHIHSHQPDGIFDGVMRELGWQDYLISENPNKPNDYRLPETTVRELALFLKEKMNLEKVRVIGNLDGKVRTVSFVGHAFDGDEEYQKKSTLRVMENGIDVVIPLETVDWTTLSYMRDAGQLGLNKAMIQVGHMNGEELGMKWAKNWLGELIDHAHPITFVPSADTYQYL